MGKKLGNIADHPASELPEKEAGGKNSRLIWLDNYFLPGVTRLSGAEKTRVRLFIWVCLITIGLSLLGIVKLVIIPLSPDERLFTISITVGFIAGTVIALLCLRYRQDFRLACHVAMAAYVATFVVLMCTVGGPLRSSTVAYMLLPPIIAFLLLGIRAGIIWSGVIYLLLFVASMVDVMGFQFPDISPPGYKSFGQLGHFGFAYFTVMAVVLFYERKNHQYSKNLQFLSSRDVLTGLLNRSAFSQAAAIVREDYEQEGRRFSVIYIDLNDFKPANDNYGHAAGDEILRTVAQRLQQAVRRRDFVCRIGGDEFALLICDVRDRKAIDRLTGVIAEKLSRPLRFNGKILAISASVGVAHYPDDGATIEALLHAADQRMYENKNRDRVTAGTLSLGS